MSQVHVDLLMVVRGEIASGGFKYICDAISYHADRSDGQQVAKDQLRNHIHSLLGKRWSLAEWLESVHGIEFPRGDREKMVQTRIAWIDWLIEEWRDAP